MANVISFRPKAELTAEENLKRFIDGCRDELSVFHVDLDFAADTWDVTDSIQRKGFSGKRQRISFCRVRRSREPATPLADEFRPFAKAYIRYMHGFRPTKAYGSRMAALQALESVLSENGVPPCPTRTDAHVLNRAAQVIAKRYTIAAAYRIGGQLALLADFIADKRLSVTSTIWRNPLPRPGDSVRVGIEFDERRKRKMPSDAALDALPRVFRFAVGPAEVLFSSIGAILCSAPDRVSEVVTLPEACEVRQTKGAGAPPAYGLRWWPAKGADPMVKWVVPSMTSVVEEAIEKIRGITVEARHIAKWYEDHPRELYLHSEVSHLRGRDRLSVSEVAEVLGFSRRGATIGWLRQKGLVLEPYGRSFTVSFASVEEAIVRMIPRGFPYFLQETSLKYSAALFVTCVNAFRSDRSTYKCMIEAVDVNKINNWLGAKIDQGHPSIFSRLGFSEPDGRPIKVTTHQFRHFLNTLAQAGGMSQLDIAKWSGRKDVRQNASYDHTTATQMLEKIRDSIGSDSLLFGPLAELSKRALIPRDEFARLRAPTAHTTDLGYCIHDYTMTPCQLHRDCIHCEDLVCLKGDEMKTEQLRQSLAEASDLLRRAQEAHASGYAGSDRWINHHQSTVERLSQLHAIMTNPSVPIGAVVQLSPPGNRNLVKEELAVIPFHRPETSS